LTLNVSTSFSRKTQLHENTYTNIHSHSQTHAHTQKTFIKLYEIIIWSLKFTLHCITLHYIAVQCIALHCIALHCIALHCIALHCIALHCIFCLNLLQEIDIFSHHFIKIDYYSHFNNILNSLSSNTLFISYKILWNIALNTKTK